jgi:hypothetical protein
MRELSKEEKRVVKETLAKMEREAQEWVRKDDQRIRAAQKAGWQRDAKEAKKGIKL